MKKYHYTPDGTVYLDDGVNQYNDTEANFLLDFGVPAIQPDPPFNDLDYDADDLDYGEYRDNLNVVQPVKIVDDLPAIDALFPGLAAAIAAKADRVELVLNPVLNLADEKVEKKRDIQIEATFRWDVVAPQFSIYESLHLFKQVFDAIDNSTPSVDLTLVFDIFQAAEDAKVVVDGLPNSAAVLAYDVVNDPAWP